MSQAGDTGVSLQPQWFDDPDTVPLWWIISIPYFYTNRVPAAPDSIKQDFTSGSIWLGPTMWDSGQTEYKNTSSGIKYAFTRGSGSQATEELPALKWFHSSSNTQELLPLNTGSGSPTGNPWNAASDDGTEAGEWNRPSNYIVGKDRQPLAFGPYCLQKTPFPDGGTDGDIMIVFTGSDILQGDTGSAGSSQYHTEDDSAVYNLLFYATGSNQNITLLGKIVGSAPGDFSFSDRIGFWDQLQAKPGAMVFVAVSSSLQGKSSLTWWPMNYGDIGSDTNNYQIIYANNAS